MNRIDTPAMCRDARLIIVMGVSASGKSTLGALLAQALGCPFLEGDDYHLPASVAKMAAGVPLTDEDRWPWLDILGAALGQAAGGEGRAVASCSALKRVYRSRLQAAAGAPILFVLPHLDRADLVERITARRDHFMPPSLIDTQLATLEMPGADEGVLVLDAREPPKRLCEQVLAALEPDRPARIRG